MNTPETLPMTPQQSSLAIEIEDVGPCSKKMRITVPAERVDEEIEQTFKNVQQSVQFKGFRPGKAPRKMVEARLGERVLAEVKERLVQTVVGEAVEERELQTIGDAQAEWEDIEITKGSDLSFEVTVDVRPGFDLPDLSRVSVERPDLKVTDEDVEQEIEKLRMARATAADAGDEPLEDRGIAILAVKIEIEGETVVDEGEVEWQHPSDVLGGMVVADMPAALLGKKTGDSVELTVTLPDNFVSEQFRGKDARLDLTVGSVQKVTIPDLDDSFAAELDYDDVEELQDDVKRQLERGLDDARDRALDDRILDAILEATPFELPPSLVKRETGRMLQRFHTQLQQDGVEEDRIGDEVAHARAEAETRVSRDLRASFVLDRIATERKVFATETEVQQSLAGMATSYNRSTQEMENEMEERGMMASLRSSIRERKTLADLRKTISVTG